MDFYDAFLDHCEALRKEGKKLIITGDVNTAHKAIDLKNPKPNEKNSGFLPEEKGPGWTNLSDMDTLILFVNFVRNQIITLGGVTELMFVKKI